MLRIQLWSIVALLATLVLLFAFQGNAILRQPLVIALLAVPSLIQVIFNSSLAYWLNRRPGEKNAVACPTALIGAPIRVFSPVKPRPWLTLPKSLNNNNLLMCANALTHLPS